MKFEEETWASYYPDALPLWIEHYKELAQDTRMKMGPDVAWYEMVEKAGMLSLVTARDQDGGLCGYVIAVVRRHTHYPVLCAFEDSFYLLPSHRRGVTGVKLITASLKVLAGRGVQKVFFMSIESKPTGKLFQYLGFNKTHETYSKWIGPQ